MGRVKLFLPKNVNVPGFFLLKCGVGPFLGLLGHKNTLICECFSKVSLEREMRVKSPKSAILLMSLQKINVSTLCESVYSLKEEEIMRVRARVRVREGSKVMNQIRSVKTDLGIFKLKVRWTALQVIEAVYLEI